MYNFILEKDFVEVSVALRNNKKLWKNNDAFGLLLKIANFVDMYTGIYRAAFLKFVERCALTSEEVKKNLDFLVSLDLIAVSYEGDNITIELKNCKVKGE